MGKITLTHAQTGQVWGPFEQSAVIGRDAECDLALPGRLVSKVHCKLERSGNGWALVDLDSTNGTFIDDHRITRARVIDGEAIAVGDVQLRLSIHPAADRAPVAVAAPAPTRAPAVVPAAKAPASLWEQAAAPAASNASAAPVKKSGGRSLRQFAGGTSRLAVVAALLGVILICAAWSAYCVVGRSPETPKVPRQLAPIDGSPSV